MQQIKPRKRRVFNNVLVGLDLVVIGAGLAFWYFGAPQALAGYWTIFKVLLALAAIHLIYTVAISPLLGRRKLSSKGNDTPQIDTLLRQEQLKSSVILESISDGVILINAAGDIQLINQSAADLFGWDKKEALGFNYQSLYKIQEDPGAATGPQGQKAADAIAETLQTGEAHQNVVQIATRSNKQFYADILASPIKGGVDSDEAKPAVVGAVVVFRDVDKQKKQEQQRTEFISTASHEMRTPVAAIEGYLALAMNDKVCLIDEKARGYLMKAHTSAEHLGQLFQDLLTSAKADDGRLANKPEVVEMSGFLEKLVEDLRFSAEKKGLGLEFVMGTDQDNISAKTNGTKIIKPLYYVEVDPDRIREVITNLFDNAVKYTQSGKITIGITGNQEVVQFYIQDTGSGIPPEDVPHLFQKFYRVDNTDTRTIGGTGLGLFICRKIVELYRGRIWVKSNLGQGSTFYVNLPRLDSGAVEAARQRLANTTRPGAAGPATAPADHGTIKDINITAK